MILPVNQKITNQKYISQSPLETALPAPKTQSAYIGHNSAFLGQSKLYSDQIQSLKNEMKEFPNDIEYRKNVMLNAGKNPDEYYKIRSIIGLGEIKSIMKEFNDNEDFYSVGINDENIKNKTIRANLHIHTLASDGYLSIEELLNKAASYADEAAKIKGQKKEPFTVAITDHDATESTKDAIEIISKDPLKYKNLRVILGAEITTYNNIAPKLLNKPIDSHILLYGFDPNEKTFSDFIDDTKTNKHDLASMMTEKANSTYKNFSDSKEKFFSIEEAGYFYNPINKNILGIHNYMESYIRVKLMLEEVVLKNPTLLEKITQRGLPSETNSLMKEIKGFYYQIDKNNKPRSEMEIMSEFLAHNLNMETNDAKELLTTAPEYKNYKSIQETIKNELSEYKVTLTPKYKYMPTMKDVYDSVKNQNGTIIGIAHPLDSTKHAKTKDEKQELLADLYKKFKHSCKGKAGFSEVYYQSYAGDSLDLKNTDENKIFMNNLSEEYDLYKTGSADSHRTNIFKRLY